MAPYYRYQLTSIEIQILAFELEDKGNFKFVSFVFIMIYYIYFSYTTFAYLYNIIYTSKKISKMSIGKNAHLKSFKLFNLKSKSKCSNK